MTARAVATILAGGLLALPAAAAADERITASPRDRYTPAEVTIDQGERVTFANQDIASHNVVAKQEGPGGKPLFGSAVAETGQEVEVEGTVHLVTGSYAFFCSLHPYMTGTLKVSSAGTPVPRPGGAPQPPPDGTAPRLTLAVPRTRLRSLAAGRPLTVRVRTDEAAALVVRATLRAGRRRLALRTARTRAAAPGVRTVRLSASRATRRALRRARRAALDVRATGTDSAGNAGPARLARTLRR
jgi:plastocyanin